MKIKFYAPLWGNTLPFDTFCANVKKAGYDGIEMGLPFDDKEKQSILDTLRKHGLELIGQYWQSFEQNIEEHAKNYEKYIRHLAAAKPVFINCQTGKDYFDVEQNKRLFLLAEKLSSELSMPIVHETHRGKCLFAAHVAKTYLDQLPSLRLTLDISHWCNVHESLLENLSVEVDTALAHTSHIHSRVGHSEGPQVNDPRAPEWAAELSAHLAWWDKVVDLHKKEDKTLTITTEFGPTNYMPALPYTREPMANQFEINVHMMNMLKERYK
jgi:sugar phosphate isomerase/epimerase